MKLTPKQKKAAMTILKLSQQKITASDLKKNIGLQTKLRFTDVVNESEWQLVNKLVKKLNK